MNRKSLLFSILFSCMFLFAKADSWTQRANSIGVSVFDGALFSIGNSGYWIGGYDGIITMYHTSWKYDTGTDTWSQVNDFPGVGRYITTGFSIGNDGYLFGGLDSNLNP